MSPLKREKTSFVDDEGKEHELTLGNLIGRGATGAVYASQLESGQYVAVKCLKFRRDSIIATVLKNKKRSTDPPSLTKLIEIENEIEIMRQVRGSFAVKLYGSLRTKNQVWLVMEICSASVTHVFNQQLNNRRYIPELIFHVFAPIMSALRKMHTLGYVHRDVKPDNILIDDFGVPKLSDFGFSSKLGDEAAKEIVGTPFFIDPNVCRGIRRYDEASDTFSLGITMACLVRPTNPLHLFGDGFCSDTAMQAFHKDETEIIKQIEDTVRSKFELDLPEEEMPEDWKKDHRFLSRCVLFDPEERPTMAKLLQLRVMHEAVKDWRKFLAGQEPSQRFLAARTKLVSLLRGENGIDEIL